MAIKKEPSQNSEERQEVGNVGPRSRRRLMTRQEAGRLGAAVRWGRDFDRRANGHERREAEAHWRRYSDDRGASRNEERRYYCDRCRKEEDPRDLFYRHDEELDRRRRR